MIKSPFNFVPLSDIVVFPEWASRISHDMPFSDGISGTISIKLTAETPIFVRNGQVQKKAETDNSERDSKFSRTADRYMLPGSTVQGAIRNVLEILSFGKEHLDTNASFSQRDWYNSSLYPIKGDPTIRCGWLRKNSKGDYVIQDCGKPMRIGQHRIDEYIKKKTGQEKIFENQFVKKDCNQLNDNRPIGGEEIDPKTAYYKYRLLEDMNLLGLLLKELSFEQDAEFTTEYSQNRMIVRNTDGGDIQGKIVLTGQPDTWEKPEKREKNKNAGKYYEFIFPSRNHGVLQVPNEMYDRYERMYAESPDWKYLWEAKPYGDKIPVFFRKNGDRIVDWGLAYMYKLPYNRTPYDTLPPNHKKEKLDMAECIFGYTRKDSSLKGRVQFSPFFGWEVTRTDAQLEEIQLLLGEPKPSYYPIYMDQEQRNDSGSLTSFSEYRTLKNGRIRGWKRYHRRNNVWSKPLPEKPNQKMITHITPLRTGTTFEGKVRFHNLRPEELGALLSALTFHNSLVARHQIGMAKSYGYGKVRLEINDIKILPVGVLSNEIASKDATFFMGLFEKYMTSKIESKWIDTPAVKELLTITSKDVRDDNDSFKYMSLDMDGTNEFNEGKEKNEFNKAKENKQYLQKFSTLIGSSSYPTTLADSNESEFEKARVSHDEKVREKIEKELQRIEEDSEKERIRELDRIEEERKAQREAAGISFLNEVNKTGKYYINHFSGVRSRINQHLKKVNKDKIPEGQWNILKETLLRLSQEPDRRERILWGDEKSSLWIYVGKITSEEFAKSVFDEINHK